MSVWSAAVDGAHAALPEALGETIAPAEHAPDERIGGRVEPSEGASGEPSRGQKCSSPSKCVLQVGQMSKASKG